MLKYFILSEDEHITSLAEFKVQKISSRQSVSPTMLKCKMLLYKIETVICGKKAGPDGAEKLGSTSGGPHFYQPLS